MARGKQLAIAGTEPTRNVEIEDAAAIYRGHMLERMDMTKREKEAKDALIGVVQKQVEDGKLELPPGWSDGEVVTVYRFQGDDGEELEIKYGRKDQVRVRKAKDGDDEPEIIE